MEMPTLSPAKLSDSKLELTGDRFSHQSGLAPHDFDIWRFLKWGYPKRVGLFHGKSHRSKWMMTGGTPISGNPTPFVPTIGWWPPTMRLSYPPALFEGNNCPRKLWRFCLLHRARIFPPLGSCGTPWYSGVSALEVVMTWFAFFTHLSWGIGRPGRLEKSPES